MIFLRFLFNFTFPTHWKTVFILLAHKLTIFFRLFPQAMATGQCYESYRPVYLTPPHIGLLLVNCCVSALIVYQSRSNQETITKYWSHVIRSFLVVLNQQHPLCRNTKHCDLFLSIDVKWKCLLCMHWVGSLTYK